MLCLLETCHCGLAQPAKDHSSVDLSGGLKWELADNHQKRWNHISGQVPFQMNNKVTCITGCYLWLNNFESEVLW